jgi:hypothetical protein
METLAASSTRSARRAVLAQRVLALGALAVLVVAAVGGAETGLGGMHGAALRVHADAGSLGWMTLGTLAVALGMSTSDASTTARANWTVPRLGMAAALALLAIIYVMGAISMLAAAFGHAAAVASLAAARSAAAAVPFVVLAATATVEWATASTGEAGETAGLSTAGTVQVGALALAAVALIAGVLTSDLPVTEANIPLELAGIAIFLVRVGPRLLTAGWARGSRIWLVTSAVALAADAGLIAHVVFEVGAQRYAYAALVPAWLVFTVDHVTLVGVGTAALLGGIAALTGQQDRWAMADSVAAVGLVLGLAGTAAGLGVGSAVAEALAGTVFGLSLLLAAAVAALRVARTHALAGRTGGGKMMSVP